MELTFFVLREKAIKVMNEQHVLFMPSYTFDIFCPRHDSLGLHNLLSRPLNDSNDCINDQSDESRCSVRYDELVT